MLINFKSGFLVTFLILTCNFVFTQTVTHKDVVLDGKPAKLNVKTGEVILESGEKATVIKTKSLTTNNGTSTASKAGDKPVVNSNTEIKSNLITKTSSKTKVVQIKTRDTILKSPAFTSENKNSKTNSLNSENEVAMLKDKATTMVYENAKPVIFEENISNFHRVKKGETLYALSQRYNTTLGTLKKANNLETTLIKIGQNLRVRNFDTTITNQDALVWTVSKGDTLYNIAHRNNTTVAALKSLNGLTSNLIKIGQKLQLK
nr:LysM peptidoglycan-binding domain-containing protein [uncultured Psychroserpens sp.]